MQEKSQPESESAAEGDLGALKLEDRALEVETGSWGRDSELREGNSFRSPENLEMEALGTQGVEEAIDGDQVKCMGSDRRYLS